MFFAVIWLGMNIYVISQTPRWSEKYITAFILGNLCLFASAAYIVFIYKVAVKIFSKPDRFGENQIQKFYQKTLWILGLAALIIPFFFIVSVPYSAHNWDFFEIFVNTSYLHGRGFSNLPMTENQLLYFLRYPNNQLFGIVSNVLFAPFGTTAKIWVETGLSAVLTSISVVSGSLIVKNIASEKIALLYNIGAFGFVPFYLYGAEFYTDTASLPFGMIGFLFIIYALKAEKWQKQGIWWILASLVISIGYAIKPTVFILMIAVVAFLVWNRKWRQLFIMLPVAAVLFIGVHEGVKAVISSDPAFSQEANNRYNLPLEHWVAMSFAPENEYGGFDPKVLAYSESFPNVAAKKKADIKLFLSNLKKQGVPGVVLQLGRKIDYTWFNGDLSDFFYTYHHQNPLVFRYFDWTAFAPNEGNVTGWLLIKAAQTLYWLALVPLMWYEIFVALFKKKGSFWFVPALSMVGLTAFLLIWEANSRYLYNFAPLMIMLAVMGLIDFLKRRKKGAFDEISD
jgi:hypothetical protein